MKKLKAIILALALASTTFAVDISGDIYGEYTIESLNKSSKLNKNNQIELNELKYIMRGDIILKNEFNPYANGVLKLQADYIPVDFNKETEVENIFIKEAYFDLLNDIFSVRMGKQFIKWGDGVFFNPADVVNVARDPLESINEAEGSPFINLSIPFQSFGALDILTVIKEKNTEKAQDMPIVAKLSTSVGNSSGFGYVMLQSNKNPVYGFDANYVFTIDEKSDISLYTEGSYKTESTKQFIDSKGLIQNRDEKSYLSISTGLRYTLKFPTMKKFDSLMLLAEYYHDNENWKRSEYKNMLETLDTNPENTGLYLPFKSAQNYIYINSIVSNAFINQMNLSISTVINNEDRSGIFMQGLTYQYTDDTEFGLKGKIFFGSNDSEFGNSIEMNEFGVYTKINF